jgi:hypothetical protein
LAHTRNDNRAHQTQGLLFNQTFRAGGHSLNKIANLSKLPAVFLARSVNSARLVGGCISCSPTWTERCVGSGR